ncbi:uncharacterized protein LOC114330000 [Diabrotica virgifera virgifera]|uniref:Circadian clock-controlled protein-like n=1 Tax=Diabrotica virgifera virgifera TaxID=50390 RepID=A0ABM5IKR0_DIAVI|nr:uncharacterized protein LOC114330000 [Diabrotica virgifera virgifera]
MKLITCSIILPLIVGQSSALIPGLLKGILDLLLGSVSSKTILIPSADISIPKNLQDIIIGDLNLTQFHVYGLDTFKYKDDVYKLDTDRKSFTRNRISVNTTLDKLGLETEYVLDMSLLDAVPLYGNGRFRLEVTKVGLDINLNLYDKFVQNMSVEDFDFRFSLRDSSNSEITGFWSNVKVSALLTNVINIVEPFVCMWYDYERECLDCVISKLAQFVINKLVLKAITNEDFIKCECLGDLSFLTKLHLPSLVESWETEDYGYIKYHLIKNPDVKKVYNKMYKIVSKIVVETFEEM